METTIKIINFEKEKYNQKDEELIEKKFGQYISDMEKHSNLDYVLNFKKTKFMDSVICEKLLKYASNYKNIETKQNKNPQSILSKELRVLWSLLQIDSLFEIYNSKKECLEKNKVKVNALEESL